MNSETGTQKSGYNCEKINELREPINNTAAEAGSCIVEILKQGIITPISSVWYSPEAVSFFEAFAGVVAKSGKNIQQVFDAYRVNVQNAGKNWADNTQGEAPSLKEIDEIELTLDVSDIKPNAPDGSVTIDEAEALNIADNLFQVQEDIESRLKSIANNLNAETAFIGHGQAEAIQNCFVQVSGEVHIIFKYLTEGENNLLSQIKAAADKYATVSTSIRGAFNNPTTETPTTHTLQ